MKALNEIVVPRLEAKIADIDRYLEWIGEAKDEYVIGFIGTFNCIDIPESTGKMEFNISNFPVTFSKEEARSISKTVKFNDLPPMIYKVQDWHKARKEAIQITLNSL